MADKKISALTALTAANVAPATDVVPIVDTSATETKKVTAKDLVDGALNGGTANGVLYLNGSKAATSGSALVFDGTLLSTTTFRATSNTASSFVSRLTNSDFQLYALNGVAGNNSGDIKATIGLYFADNIANLSSGIHFARGSAATNGWLNFVTNGAETMRLDSSGNLGIGTSSPTEKLTVNGGAAFNGIGFNANAINTSSTSSRFVRLTSTGGDFYVGTESSTGGGVFPGSTAYAAVLYNASATPMQFWTGGTLRATLDSSGNLGIGTSSPAQRLDVTGALNSVQARFGNVAGRGLTIGTAVVSGTNDAGVVFNAPITEGALIFQTNSTERARIDANGNIVAGASAALATTATNGFLYVPTCAGTPTGTPTAITGMAPIVVNTTNNKLYFYSGGAWRDAGP